MTIVFSCPECFHHYRLRDEAAGRTIRCRQCRSSITVPGAVGRFAREPREIQLSESIRLHLLCLRLLGQADSGEGASLHPPVLAVEAVRDVEKALGCLFPEDVLGLFAEGALLAGDEFRIEQVVSHTRRAHRQRCPRDLIAIGESDGHVYYCVSRYPPLDQCPSLVEYVDEDGSTGVHFLADWLAREVEARREFIAAADPERARRKPTAEELASYRPRLAAGGQV